MLAHLKMCIMFSLLPDLKSKWVGGPDCSKGTTDSFWPASLSQACTSAFLLHEYFILQSLFFCSPLGLLHSAHSSLFGLYHPLWNSFQFTSPFDWICLTAQDMSCDSLAHSHIYGCENLLNQCNCSAVVLEMIHVMLTKGKSMEMFKGLDKVERRQHVSR